MNHPGWLLIVLGLVIVLVGACWLAMNQWTWFGKLPGDLVIIGENSRLYFPITTCLIVSTLLTLGMWILSRWR